MMQIINAFDAMDGITFSDIVGIFAGTGAPQPQDDGTVPDGSIYIQSPAGLWQKRNGVWIDLGALSCSCPVCGGDHSDGHDHTGDRTILTPPANPAPAIPAVMPEAWMMATLFSSNRSGGQVIPDGEWTPRTLGSSVDPHSMLKVQGSKFSVLSSGMYHLQVHAVGKGVLGLLHATSGNVLLEGHPSKDGLVLSGVVDLQAGVDVTISNWSTEEYIVGAGSEVNALRDEITVFSLHIRKVS